MNTFMSYIQACFLLHIITLLELALIAILIPSLLPIPSGSTILSILCRIYFIGFLLSLPVFSQLDARSRFQNYKQIKDQLFQYGFDIRIFKPIIKSRCQRDAALFACADLGLKNKGVSYFRSFGYRWYHIIPDYIYQKPQFLLTKYFWRTTFFTPIYSPKFDYSETNTVIRENPNLMHYG